MAEFIRYQGKLVTPFMAWVLDNVAAWLKKTYGMALIVRDAIRTHEEQRKIFFDRYVVASEINGRRVYDMRWFEGRWYYRISPAGTVAQPLTSNHEIQGTGDEARAAVDIADSGHDAGITVPTSARGRAFRAVCKSLGLENEGDSFGEGWHFLIRGINRAVPGTPASVPAPSKPKPRTPQPADMLDWKWTGIQRMLKANFGYTGKIDNDPGAGTKMAMRRFLTKKGYSKRANGWGLAIKPLFNKNDVMAIQVWLRGWGYDGAIDGIPGKDTRTAWDKAEAANGRAFSRFK